MGKDRRQRQKFHISTKNKPNKDGFDATMDTSQPILIQPSENLFSGIDIKFDSLKKDLDDTHSVKSFKSIKSEASGNRILKKDKLKLRRDLLLKKIDTINQAKVESKRRSKRTKISIIGDTNPLHDALPSLESLLSSRSSTSSKKANPAKPKAIQKAPKRKKQLVQGVQILKNLMANKDFQKNPKKMISQHVEAVVAQGNKKQ